MSAIEPCIIEQCEIDKYRKCNTLNPQCNNYIFESREDMRKSFMRICYGDLYVLGRIWIVAMKTVLVGHKLSLIPVVEAAKPEALPQRPPPMRYKDLCIYKSPHYEYKDYEEDKLKCPEYKVKIAHRFFLPYVKNCRKEAQKTFQEYKNDFEKTFKDTYNAIEAKKKEFKTYMRHPDNLVLGRGVVAAATIAGFLVGRRMGRHRDSIMKGLIYGGLGALAAGALCFPKETDKNFRCFCYEAGKIALLFINLFCRSSYAYKDKIPCDNELPPHPPPQKKPNVCPAPKK